MASRGSQQAQDEITWQTVGVALGGSGLDLRQPSQPTVLTELLNARFVDDRTIEARSGHIGRTVQDSSDFAPLGPDYRVSDTWVYGHGIRVDTDNAASWENAHHPMAGRGAATFRWGNEDAVLTGDRLIVMRDGTGLGSSVHWDRTGANSLPQGIPAFLPVQMDSTPPAAIGGEYVDTCLTDTLRGYIHNGTLLVTAWILDRTTGAVINEAEISGVSNDPVETRIVNSGGTIVAIWRDYTDRLIYYTHWTGVTWAAVNHFGSNVYAWDLAVTPTGFTVAWRQGSPGADALKLGAFVREIPSTVYPFASTITTSGTVNGPVAVAVSPGGDVGILYSTASGLETKTLNSTLTETLGNVAPLDVNVGPWNRGLAICSRGLKGPDGNYTWVAHASRADDVGVQSWEFAAGTIRTAQRHNATLASRSFLVGDEVFCWLRSTCAGTHYLLAGHDEIAGYCDREVAVSRTTHDDNYGIPAVTSDPLNPNVFTWTRPYNTGQSYLRGGNVHTGDIDFSAEPTIVEYGRSIYISGCSVRNWDGVVLGHAGFQDYPTVKTITTDISGVLTPGAGSYFFRVYIVKYNARGERFCSAAETSGELVLTGTDNNATVVINQPSSVTEDCTLEIYRTEAGGTTFYLDGTVDVDPTVATVNFTVQNTDAQIISQPADPHAAGVGQISEIETFGPLGCSLIAVAGDRIWGAGGLVPAGLVQFSLLKEDGSGAGFDDLAGFQAVDNEGGAITSVAALNDTTVIFQLQKLYVIAGTGPDNYGRGAFSIPQIVLTDGAVNHYGTIATQLGLGYWGALGPRILTSAFSVQPISAPVRILAETITPTGARVNLARQEVTWYTSTGDALLMCYSDGTIRWARWIGLPVAGVSRDTILTTDGRLLEEDETAVGDAGQPFDFVWQSGEMRPEQILGGATQVRAVGVSGKYLGEHELDIRVFYNGSPLWIDHWVWEPEVDTWLTPGSTFATLTPATIDGLNPLDHSGAYLTHKRTSRQDCHTFRVRASDFEVQGPTYIPFELTAELGSRGGLGRVPVNTFSS